MELKTKDHPEADGKKARYGDVEHVISFELEGGQKVTIRMGEATWQAHTQNVLDMLANAPAGEQPDG